MPMFPFGWHPDGFHDAGRRSRRSGGEPAPMDEHLAGLAARALRDDPLIYGTYLEIIVQNGVVILRGELGSEQAREAARQRAWKVPGVLDVLNQVTVSVG